LSLRGNFQAEQLFDGQCIAEVVRKRVEVVDAVGEWNNLMIKLGLAGLFDAGVQVTDFGIDADNDFAVNLQHQAQHSMRRRMLRPHVDDHVLVFGALRRLQHRHG
jgi:hypothetical protein